MEFGDWLFHKLTFMCVDTENCKNEEETFVVIYNTKSLYVLLHNLCKIENVIKNVHETVWYAINIASNCNDILELINNDFGVSTILLSKEEHLKLNILKRMSDFYTIC